MRNPLLKNQTIKLQSENDAGHMRTFIIQKVLGSGASCIAYKSLDAQNRLPAIIKECFPCNAAIREKSGSLEWSSTEEQTLAKEMFVAAYEQQLKIQSADEMTNANTHLIDGLYNGNNTLYSINDMQFAQTYNAVKDSSLQDVFITAKSIAYAVGQYHAHGLLHLDIKPQNILILPETRQLVKLLDFDSVIRRSDAMYPGVSLSYTQEYAAPELLQGKRSKLCKATDIYSIGAVLFSRIMGRVPSAADRGTFSDWEMDEHPLMRQLSGKTHRLTKELLRKTLSASIRGRFQETDSLISALNELIYESDPKRRYLNSTCHTSLNYFTGRGKELGAIHAGFSSGKHAVFLHGMGGLGKTELALRYAVQYGTRYDAIAFGRYSDSLEALFTDTSFISIENNLEGKTDLSAVRGLADERTLLIIDSFDAEDDPKLEDVLSLRCKLLFTSRNSFEELYGNDESTTHIQIAELLVDEQMAVFEHVCGHVLSERERCDVNDILNVVDGYTLLIPLLAKQYNKDDLSLAEMRQRICVAGVKCASCINVRHHKDKAMSGSLYGILCEVLNMAELSEIEIHVLRSLGILGEYVIERKKFNAWLGGKYKNAVNTLAEKSWVQCQGAGPQAKLSLHKVIGEIVRDEFNPTLENCPEIKRGIWEDSLEISENISQVYYDTTGYMETGISMPYKCTHDRFRPLMSAVFKYCNLSDQTAADFWASIICNATNPMYGDIDEYEDFLISYANRAVTFPVSLHKAYLSLMRYSLCKQLRRGDISVLSLAEKVMNRTSATAFGDELDVEQTYNDFKENHGDAALDICLPVYQRICVLDAENKEYWEDIPDFNELCIFIDGIWPESKDTIDYHAYEDFHKRISCEYIEQRLQILIGKDIDIDVNETVGHLDSHQLLADQHGDNRNTNDELSDYFLDVIDGLDPEKCAQFMDKCYPDVDNEIYRENAENAFEGWAAEMILQEVEDALEFSPIDVNLLPSNIVASWSETKRHFNLCNIKEIEEEFYSQIGKPDADVEVMLSCAYLLVGEYGKCKDHLAMLLACYQDSLSIIESKITFDRLKYLPGYKNLFDVYSEIIPANLALWFISEIIRIAETANASNNMINDRLVEAYSYAAKLARTTNDTKMEMYYISKTESFL